MEERMFVDPVTGDMHPESWYHRENVDLATVIECHLIDGNLAFDVNLQNLNRLNVQAPEVFNMFAHFCAALVEESLQTEDDEEREHLQATAAYVSRVMMSKLGVVPTEH